MQLVSTSKRINAIAKENTEVQYDRPTFSKKKYLSVHSQRQSQFLINQSHKNQNNKTHSPTIERKARLHLTCLSTPKAIYKKIEFHSIKTLSQPIFQLITSYVGLLDTINFLNSCRDFRNKRFDLQFQQSFTRHILRQGIEDTNTCLKLVAWLMQIRTGIPNQALLSTIPCKIQETITKEAMLFCPNEVKLSKFLKKLRILYPNIRLQHNFAHLCNALSSCIPENALLTITDAIIKKLSLDKIFKGGSETRKLQNIISQFSDMPVENMMKRWIEPLFCRNVFTTSQWLNLLVAAMCLGWKLFGSLLIYLLSGKRSYEGFIKLVESCQDNRILKLSSYMDNKIVKKPSSQSRQKLTPLGAKRHSQLAYPISKNERNKDSFMDITCITDVRDSSFCTL